MQQRQGKCTNYAGCLLAYRNETIIIPEGDFICPECQQPLAPVSKMTPAGPKLIPGIIVGGITTLVIIGAIAVYMEAKRVNRNPPAVTTSAASTVSAPATSGASTAAIVTPGVTPLPGTDTAPSPAAVDALPVPEGSKPGAPNLDLSNAENQRVKAEVLKRIDLMPTISSENKDKLYVSVERARNMGKIITIPFASGKTTLEAGDVAKLKAEATSQELKELVQDPTCVFVILGFADKKGDEKANLKISQERAQSVLNTLRDKCGIVNVMHAVGMGGSTLFNEQGEEKNRVAEVWAVLP